MHMLSRELRNIDVLHSILTEIIANMATDDDILRSFSIEMLGLSSKFSEVHDFACTFIDLGRQERIRVIRDAITLH